MTTPNGSPRLALVTGANGFIGRVVCRYLSDRGVMVRALVRDPSARVPGAETVVLDDLGRVGELRAAFQGVDTVIHLAARVHDVARRPPAPYDDYHRVNVEVTERLLDTAISVGARRFVFASSVKAVGERSGVPWTEQTEPHPVDPYGVSKLEAERVVRALADRHEVHAPILRLPLVYGPGVKANMRALFRVVDRGIPVPLGSVTTRRSLLFVGNLCAAVTAVIESPAAARETFFVSDGEDLSTAELVRRIATALQRPARLVSVPTVLLKLGARAGGALATVHPAFGFADAVDRLLSPLQVDIRKIETLTGYRPSHTVDEGLRLTAEWYRTRGAVLR